MTTKTTTAKMDVWDEVADAWTTLDLPRHAYVPDPTYAGLRRWCRVCIETYDERWTPEHEIHKGAAR